MKGNEAYDNGNSPATGLWVIFGVVILAAAIYYFSRSSKRVSKEPQATHEEADGATIEIVVDHLKSFYSQVRNRLARSYRLMYSVPLNVDRTLSEESVVTDLGDLGIAYKPAKYIGYPYLARLANSSDDLDWHGNLSTVHNVMEKLAEADVIKDVLESHSSKLESQDLQDLKSRKLDLEKECEPFSGIRDIVTT